MKALVVIKSGTGGIGASQATRYVSRRERDEAREGQSPRLLFSEREDGLSFHRANRLLGGGSDPKTDDVLHLVISLEKEECFNQLGTDEESRQNGLRETTRDAMKHVTEDLNADNLRWVAGIHRNTDNPHVHLLIHRDYADRETNCPKRLKTLPMEMRVSWERTQDGSRVVNPGSFSRTFETFLDQRIEKARQSEREGSKTNSADAKKEYEERVLLGRAMVAEDKIERLTLTRAAAVKYGERFRFEFTNGRGRSRGFSERDLHQRGWARAGQAAANLPALTPELRRQLREETAADELMRNGELLNKHRKTRNADLVNLEIKLERATQASRHLIEKASTIKRRYEDSGIPAPTPIIPRAKLAELQDRAIERGDAERVRVLEEIRVALATEAEAPARTETEIGRLVAQLFVARAGLAAEQESERRFEDNKHLLRWDLSRESPVAAGRAGEKSLAEVERSLIWEKDQAKFIGSRYVHWDDDRRREAKLRVEKLTRLRESVLDRIEAERAALFDQTERKAELVETLYKIHSEEGRRRISEGHEMPAPLFSLQELKGLDTIASRLRDPDFYRTLRRLERDYDARTDQKEPVSVAVRAGRAQARATMAEISLREAELNLAKFHERQEWIDVIVKDDGGRNIEIARLADGPLRQPLETLLRPFIAEDKRHREIPSAVEAHGARLIEEHKKAWVIHDFLAVEARVHMENFARAHPGMPMPEPRFTPWEISKLELHAAKEIDPALKEKYEKLYCDALENEHEDRLRRILIEKDADELLDPVSAGASPPRNTLLQDHAHYPTSHEMSFER
jgi:relaxase MobL-like protein